MKYVATTGSVLIQFHLNQKNGFRALEDKEDDFFFESFETKSKTNRNVRRKPERIEPEQSEKGWTVVAKRKSKSPPKSTESLEEEEQETNNQNSNTFIPDFIDPEVIILNPKNETFQLPFVPQEIWNLIISYLTDPRDLARVSTVCKLFRKIVFNRTSSFRNSLAFHFPRAIPINAAALARVVFNLTAIAAQNKRKFEESVEMQISLNYDCKTQRRFILMGTLPHLISPRMKICLLGDEIELHQYSVLHPEVGLLTSQQLWGFGRDRKRVKRLGKKWDAFICSDTIIRSIPRMLGPGLNKLGKFPTTWKPGPLHTVEEAVNLRKRYLKCPLKKLPQLNCSIGTTSLTMTQLAENIMAVLKLINDLISSWRIIKRIVLKTTMGIPHTLCEHLIVNWKHNEGGSTSSGGSYGYGGTDFYKSMRLRRKRIETKQKKRASRVLNRNRKARLIGITDKMKL